MMTGRTCLLLGLVFLLSGAQLLRGQTPTAIRPGYSFKDGIYPNLESFQRDRPQYSMFNVEFSAVVNEEKHIVQVEWIRHKRGDTLRLDSIWGLCWRGQPYIRIPADSTHRKLAIFAALQIVGNICLFNYETEVEKLVEIKAYFPDTGIPFRSGKIKNTATVIRERMLRMSSGALAPLNQQNLYDWMHDYPELQKAVMKLSPETLGEGLPRLIKVYNEHNPVYLK